MSKDHPGGDADPPGTAPSALFEHRTGGLFHHLPVALAGDPEAVHQLRVSSRRLRVALRLLVEKANGRRARRTQRQLARLTRIAGRARDLDVLVEAFDGRLGTLPSPSSEQRQLRRRLADLRRRGRVHALEELRAFEVERLRADLAKLATRCCRTPSATAKRFARSWDRQGRKLKAGFAELGAELEVPDLHRLRRRARGLRYGVEIYVELFGADAHATKPWKELQERIGVLHDHYLLSEWFEQQVKIARTRGQSALAAAASAEVDWARETMARLHAELRAADPKALVTHGLAAVAGALPAR